MEEQSLLAYLRLLNNSLFGPYRLSQTLVHFGSLNRAIATPDDELQQLGYSLDQSQTLKDSALFSTEIESVDIERAIEWHSGSGCALITYESKFYPHLLKEIAIPPPLLFCSGRLSLLESACCAIVGSRDASRYGLRIAKWLAYELSLLGFTIVSGVARGIDAAAHHGALLGTRNSIGVIGTGIDRTYPSSNESLTRQLHSESLVISEFPLGSPPRANHFPQRNRTLSGLSIGVVVIEASLRSGSLITANLALEQNRTVFAVPGPIDSPRTEGCHKLLREGARLVTSPEDVCEELLSCWATPPKQTAINQSAPGPQPAPFSDLSSKEQQILSAITENNMLIDSLVETTQLTPAFINSALTQLELKGAIEVKGGRVQRCN